MRTREEIMDDITRLQREKLNAEALAERLARELGAAVMELHGCRGVDGSFHVRFLNDEYLVTYIEAAATGGKPFIFGQRIRNGRVLPAQHFLGDAWEPLP